jgi:hypothetical protein
VRKPADRAARHTDRQHIEQEHLKPLRAISDPLVEPDVRPREHERQDAEEKDTNGRDASPESRDDPR